MRPWAASLPGIAGRIHMLSGMLLTGARRLHPCTGHLHACRAAAECTIWSRMHPHATTAAVAAAVSSIVAAEHGAFLLLLSRSAKWKGKGKKKGKGKGRAEDDDLYSLLGLQHEVGQANVLLLLLSAALHFACLSARLSRSTVDVRCCVGSTRWAESCVGFCFLAALDSE